MNKKRQSPKVATHPGELIKDELNARKMTQKQLSKKTGIQQSVLSETINCKRPISLSLALALEKCFEISAEYWLNLQSQYNIDSQNITNRDKKEKVVVTIPTKDRGLLKELSLKFGWVAML